MPIIKKEIKEVAIWKVTDENESDSSSDHDFMPVQLDRTQTMTHLSIFKRPAIKLEEEVKSGCFCFKK